jgi:hypothetical protein
MINHFIFYTYYYLLLSYRKSHFFSIIPAFAAPAFAGTRFCGTRFAGGIIMML